VFYNNSRENFESIVLRTYLYEEPLFPLIILGRRPLHSYRRGENASLPYDALN